MLVTNTGKGKSRKESLPTTEMTVQLTEALEYGDPVIGSKLYGLRGEFITPEKMSPNYSYTCDWSPNGQWLAVGQSASPFMYFYDWQSGAPVYLNIVNPGFLPPASPNKCAWSPNGKYLAVTHGTTPFVTLYDWREGNPQMKIPATLPHDTGRGCCWSPDSRYLIITHTTTPFITIYDWQSGAPVKRANPATLPPNNALNCSWSPNGRYLFVGCNYTPYMIIYDWQSGNPVKIADPVILPTSFSKNSAWSPDSRYLAIGMQLAPYIAIYDWQSGVPIKLPDLDDIPTNSGSAISWSHDGKYLALTFSAAPNMIFYDWGNGSPIKIRNPINLPVITGADNCWSPGSDYFVTVNAISGLPNVFIIKLGMASGYEIRKFDKLRDTHLIDTLSAYGKISGLGYSRGSHNPGDTVTFDLIRFGSEDWRIIRYGNVYDLSATSGLENIRLFWKDPEDAVDATKTIKWSGTLVVRKLGGYPIDETDGDIVIDNMTRNIYATVGFLNSGLLRDTTYHYQAFPYFEDGTIVRDEKNRISALSLGVAPGNVSAFTATADISNLRIGLRWTDPVDSFWAGTKIVRKAGSYPTSISDGVVIIDNAIRNKHSSTILYDSGLSLDATYYYQAFPYSISGIVNTNATNRVNVFLGYVFKKYPNAISALSTSRKWSGGAGNAYHAVFAGGTDYGQNSYYATVDAYNTTLTRSSATLSKGAMSISGDHASGYLVFGGGYRQTYEYSTVVDAFAPSTLTRSNPTSLSYGRAEVHACTSGDYCLFGGGRDGTSTWRSDVDAYYGNLSRSTPMSLSYGRYNASTAKLHRTHALFGPGAFASTNVDAYNNSLTRTIVNLSASRSSIVGTYNSNYAIFAGGDSAGTVDAFNSTLTRITPSTLSGPASSLTQSRGGTLMHFAIVALNSTNAFNLFNPSMVRTTYSTPFTTTRSGGGVTTMNIEGAINTRYCLFAGGDTGSAVTNIVEAFYIE